MYNIAHRVIFGQSGYMGMNEEYITDNLWA